MSKKYAIIKIRRSPKNIMGNAHAGQLVKWIVSAVIRISNMIKKIIGLADFILCAL